MKDPIETVEALLGSMGFPLERVAASVAALRADELAPQPTGRLMTPRELQSALGISSTSLWRLQPPFVYVGGRKRYDWQEIRAFLANQKTARTQRERGES
jgi:hypothetical protein